MKKLIGALLVLAAAAVMLVASGGGSGDGNGSGSGEEAAAGASGETVAEYSGSTSQADLTEDNAEELSRDVLDNSMTAVSFDLNREEGRRVVVERTMHGECGGTATYRIDADVMDNSFEGEIDFIDLCDHRVILNGQAGLSGTYEREIGAFSAAEAAYTDLDMTYGPVRRTLSGSLIYSRTENGYTAEMDSSVYNSVTRDVRRVLLRTAVVKTQTERRLTVEGRFYHPDYGYVMVSTPTAFRIQTGEAHPEIGFMTLEGTSNRTVHLIAGDSSTFRVDADLDGDGAVDYTSGNQAWPF